MPRPSSWPLTLVAGPSQAPWAVTVGALRSYRTTLPSDSKPHPYEPEGWVTAPSFARLSTAALPSVPDPQSQLAATHAVTFQAPEEQRVPVLPSQANVGLRIPAPWHSQ